MGTGKQRTAARLVLARRTLIQRTARIWTRLTGAFLESAHTELTPWLEQVMTSASADAKTGKVKSIPDIPKGYAQTLRTLMLHGIVYGYWLSHLHVQEIRKAFKQKLSDDTELRTKLESLLQNKIKLADAADSRAKSKKAEKTKKTNNIQSNSVEWNAVIPETAIDWLDSYTLTLAGVLQEDVLNAVRDVVSDGMKEGLPVKERMNRLRAASVNLQSMTQHRLETIARTELTRADTMGRLIEYHECPDVDGVEFNAILDPRTTPYCRERHGLIMRLDDKRLAQNTPPLHPNCRSMLLATTIYEHKGKLQTSSAFDEVTESIQRDIDIQAVQIAIGQLPFGRQ